MKPPFVPALPSVMLAIAVQPALAQDISPVFDLPTMAQGQVISSTAKNQGHRAAQRGPTASRAEICAQRPRLRRQYGAGHAKVQQLDSLCLRDGFGS